MDDTVEEGLVNEYKTSLEDLTVNSKPLIDMLTVLAGESGDYANRIAGLVEDRLLQVKPNSKLPILYLIDSMVKNVGHYYKSLFNERLVYNFTHVFATSDAPTKQRLHSLRSTWNEQFDKKKLYDLDVAVKALDNNWPIQTQATGSQVQENSKNKIHINPRFFGTAKKSGAKSKKTMSYTENTSNKNAKLEAMQAEYKEKTKEIERIKTSMEHEALRLQLDKKTRELQKMQAEERQKRMAGKPITATGLKKSSSMKVAKTTASATNKLTQPIQKTAKSRSVNKKVTKNTAPPAKANTLPNVRTVKKNKNDPRTVARSAVPQNRAVKASYKRVSTDNSSSDSTINGEEARFSPEPDVDFQSMNQSRPPPRKRSRTEGQSIFGLFLGFLKCLFIFNKNVCRQ